jgi:Domain of unknown function (DUF4296)
MVRLLFLFLLLSSSCHFQQTGARPSVSDEKMARVMADLCIADAATNGIIGYERDSLMQAYFQQVLQLHGLTQEQHENNLRIYANDMAKMKELLEQAEMLLDTSKRVQ